MTAKTILVTGVGGDIGQSVIKCLREARPRQTIIGCDTDLYAAGRGMTDDFFQAPSAGKLAQYERFISQLITRKKIKYLLPTSEPEILFYGSRRSTFAQKGVTLFINDPFCLETFFDKFETAEFLKQNGFLHPRTHLIEDFRGQLPYPVLVKRRHGWGGKGLYVVRNSREMAFHRNSFKDGVVQEIVGVPDEEYTAGVFSDGKATHSIAFRRDLGYGSLSKVAKLVRDPEIEKVALKLARAVDLKGSLNVQMRKTAKGYVPLEINPRFSSTVYVRHCFGFQDVRWWMDMMENKEIEFKPRYKAGVAVRCLSETFFELKK